MGQFMLTQDNLCAALKASFIDILEATMSLSWTKKKKKKSINILTKAVILKHRLQSQIFGALRNRCYFTEKTVIRPLSSVCDRMLHN